MAARNNPAQTEATKAKISAGIKRAYAEGRVRPRQNCGRRNGEYYTSGRLAEHCRSISQLGGFASGRARGVPLDLYAARQRMSTCLGAARRRGLAWELTEEQFRELSVADCWYCGAKPAQEQKKFEGIRFNGIDRVDNAGGYTSKNVVTACARCNRAKHTMGQSEFIELASRIAERHRWNKR